MRNNQGGEQSACQGKWPYISAHLAHQTAKRMNAKRKGVQVYRCNHCGSFHIGGHHMPAMRKPKPAYA